MMTQKQLPIKYFAEKKSNKITNYGGLFPLLELISQMKIFEFSDTQLNVRSGSQGWLDSHHFLSIFLINFIGGDCVSDVEILESDPGLTAAMLRIESGILNKCKRFISDRFRKGRQRIFPSDKALHDYALCFHNEAEEKRRPEHKAFIPTPNENLQKLNKLFKRITDFVQVNNPQHSATVDVDAVICPSNKRTSFFSYKKAKGYQPLNAYWHEQGTLLFSEFRDGNVNGNYRVPEFVKEAFSNVPERIAKRYLRMDSAGYNFELMEYCDSHKIGFSISASLCKSLKDELQMVADEEWKKISLTEGQLLKRVSDVESGEKYGWEWAELPYIPDDPRGDKYRYIAIRSKLITQKELFEVPGLEGEGSDGDEAEMSKKQYEKDGIKYRIRVIVTNRQGLDGEVLFHWHNKRCGYSEHVHSVMKNDLCGGQFPSSKFGANAFWWLMMIFSLNILQIYKSVILGGSWGTRRLKAFRLHFIYVAGRITGRARYIHMYLRNSDIFNEIREKILKLKWVPI
jgi:hypothetical protein